MFTVNFTWFNQWICTQNSFGECKSGAHQCPIIEVNLDIGIDNKTLDGADGSVAHGSATECHLDMVTCEFVIKRSRIASRGGCFAVASSQKLAKAKINTHA